MKKLVMFAIVAVLSLGVLAGCGGGGGGGAAVPMTVNMGEGGAMSFSPASLEVTKGQTVELTIVNKDSAQAHSFIQKDLNIKSSQVQPGKTEVIKFTADKTGEFQFICDVPGHKDGGMVGKVIVK